MSDKRNGKPDVGAAPRAAAARVLAQVLLRKSSLPEAFDRHGGEVETALVRELAWGSARHALRLRELVTRHLRQGLKERDTDILALLMIGAYQLGWTRIPPHAAVHATVGATSALGKPWARGLANAILRKLTRLDLQAADVSPSATAGLPEWLLERIQAAWPEHWQQIADAGLSRPPMTLRARDVSTKVLDDLRREGLSGRAGTVAPQAIYLEEPRPVEDIPGFSTGALSVQDEGAQLAAILLEPQAGERVLDACAAPGGKTLQMLQMQGDAHITAVELEAARADAIRSNLQRAGMQAEVLVGDARDASVLPPESFDAILLDAPCTATGILRRQPDIRLLRVPGDVAKLARTQRELMEALWPRLRAGGRMIYCTCSVLPEEGEDVVASFSAAHPDVRVDPIETHWGIATPHGRMLLPHPDSHDGFFLARLIRR